MASQALTGNPAPDEVRRALNAIRTSRHLVRSESLIRFLEYVVEQKLAGKEDEIKEATVGVAVFHRGRFFDSRVDPVVRVEARLLRAKLAAYYASEGARDAVRIGLPKGGYVPDFQIVNPVQSTTPSRLSLWRITAAVLVLAVAAVLGLRFWPRPGVASVAVLPLLNLTGDPGNDYLCDGLTEELTDTLARVPGLRVVARTSAFHFKGKAQDVRGIGAQLGVGHVIEGSVFRTGGQMRVTLQMSRTSDGYHVLSRSFEGRLLDLVGRQTDLAVPLIAVLRPGALAPQRRKPVPEAHDLLLKAAALRGAASLEAYEKGLAFLEQAIRIDPAYADAYAALAGTYAIAGANYEATALESVRLGKAAAAKALELDPDCAAAYGVLGFSDAIYLLDWKSGEDGLRRAIRLEPSGAAFYNWLGNVLMYQGRFDEALVQLRTAEQLDPLSPVLGITEGAALFYARRYDAALERLMSVQRSYPDTTIVHLWIGRAWQGKGALDKAMREYRMLPASIRDFMIAGLLARQGQRDAARALLSRLEHPAPEQGRPRAFNLAYIHAMLGDRDQAFEWLQRAYEDRKITQLKVDPELDSIRGDPRYTALLRKTGLGR
jgi:serine/threonine-protein kinase